jgi:peptide-methionine (S)-S-oxide reductase
VEFFEKWQIFLKNGDILPLLIITMRTLAFIFSFLIPFQIMTANDSMEEITLGGGCFWCLEALYERLPGVQSVVSGYAGGHKANPSYQEVVGGTTGHAEVVRVRFDTSQIGLAQILAFFWVAHDPTTFNRQGADVGTQYRSIILFSSDGQRKVIEESMVEARGKFADPIVTAVEPLEKFYEAEEYHQDYFARNPEASYCRYVIVPKIEKLESKGKL